MNILLSLPYVSKLSNDVNLPVNVLFNKAPKFTLSSPFHLLNVVLFALKYIPFVIATLRSKRMIDAAKPFANCSLPFTMISLSSNASFERHKSLSIVTLLKKSPSPLSIALFTFTVKAVKGELEYPEPP